MLSKIKKYRHGFIIAIYFVAYLILFGYLEQRPVRAYHVVHTGIIKISQNGIISSKTVCTTW